jgi:outer membrane protein
VVSGARDPTRGNGMKKFFHIFVIIFFFFTFSISHAGRKDISWSQESFQNLSLEQALKIALANNRSLKSARQNLRAANFGVSKAVTEFFPRITFNTQLTRFDDWTLSQMNFQEQLPPEFRVGFFPTPKNSYISGLSITQPIYNGGKLWANLGSAKALRSAGDHLLEETTQDVILKTKAAYFDLLKAEELLKLRQDFLTSAKNNLKSVEAKLEVGLRSRSDVLRWEVQVASEEGNLVEAENLFESAQENLKNLLGVDIPYDVRLTDLPDGKIERAKRLFENFPERDLTPLIEEWYQVAVRNNPTVGMISSQVAVQKNLVKMAWGEFQPSFNFAYEYGWQRDKDVYLNGQTNWSATVVMSIPLYTSLYNFSNLGQARANLNKAKAEKEDYLLNLKVALTNAILNAKAAFLTIDIAHKGMLSAEENFKIIKDKFDLGLASNIDLLDAQIVYNTSRMDEINALYDYLIALAQVDRVIGIVDFTSKLEE